MARSAWVCVLGLVGCAEVVSEPVDDAELTWSGEAAWVPDAAVDSEDAEAVVDEIVLVLETRDGTGSQGWSFGENGLVDADEAHLVLSSWDCGARGRWVTMEARGVELCLATADGALDAETCAHEGLEIGGSQPEVALGDRVFVRVDGEVVPLVLVDRTDTPFEWYEAEDLGFEVVLGR